VINQCDGSERKCIARAQRMFLKNFQLRLFGTLPFGDRSNVLMYRRISSQI